ncbi:MAG TPA: CGNR zinc finger domain-containing protein [Candidatus Nesterenkonia stercoripullorum]|uniref:CGNR zinc finger domain-containing protein n=1 Tax=Candidatus Nesterenkonia stercoripullorum TaxID=2838701 RepID=A0A9D1UV26_9MICC|nr:CGNR zinc finger domain-containing protein [Candidatus Nesterenkonia stercoripullorum]
MIEDEDLLLAVLNSAPVIDGVPTDQLGGAGGRDLLERFGGAGTEPERAHMRETRDALFSVIRHESEATDRLAAAMSGAALLPEVTSAGLRWHLSAPADERLSARAVLAWSRVQEQLPGRLRPCANTECHLFLIDHSRPGTARWCSMATCGNRIKARTHARRTRTS